MAGRLGDAIPLDALASLTQTMLAKSLVQVTLEVPGGETRTMISVDFTDSKDPNVIKARNGFHPMGSAEWTGGVILALEKNAVRFQNAGRTQNARDLKAMAELLKTELLKMFYDVKGMKMVPYATGQGMAVGHGWNTPFFYVKNASSGFQGGSFIGGWGILPINGINPFILGDNFAQTYDQILISADDEQKARAYVALATTDRSFQEAAVTKGPDAGTQIVESGQYNALGWAAFVRNDYKQAIVWARKVVDDPSWIRLAKEEQAKKAKAVGGLIFYPWGTTFPQNSDRLHTEIWKYPLLNEVSAAIWILAASNYELGKREESKKWMKRIITEFPYHQIADVVFNPSTGKKDLIDGYWNAVISWKSNPGNSPRDAAMGKLAMEAGVNLETPEMVMLPKPAVQEIVKLAAAITKSPVPLPPVHGRISPRNVLPGLEQNQTFF